MEKGEKCKFNFGLRPFNLRPNFHLIAVNEADCQINNFYTTSVFLMDRFKNYVMASKDPKHLSLSETEKIMVGSVLLEYLMPLIDDPFVFEAQIVYFFYELALINKKELVDIVFKTFQLHCSQGQFYSIMTRIFTVLVHKIVH